MLGLSHMSPIKQALFTNFLELKCYDLQSHSLLIIVWLARFLSQMTIINYSSLVTDSSFSYLLQLYNIMAVYESGETPRYFFQGVSVIVLICVWFLWMMCTGAMAQNRQIKVIFLKVFGLLVYGSRVFMVKNLADVGYRSYKQGNVGLLILLSIAIALICVISVLLQEFSVQISLKSSHRSLLSKTYHKFNSISQVILLMTVILTSMIPQISIEFVSAFSILLAVSFSLKLLSSTLRKKYSSSITQRLQNINCVSGIIFYISVIPAYYVELLKQNLFVTMIVVTIFCYNSYTNYLNSLRFDSVNFLESITKSKEELLNREGKFYLFQAHFLIHYVNYMMTEFKGEKEQILLSSILVEHFRQCRKDNCYCTNNAQTNMNKLILDKEFRGKLLLAFVQNIHKEFSHQFDIFALYLMFKLQIIGIFPEIEHALLKYQASSTSLTLAQQYIIFQIKNTLKRILNEKNLSTEYVRVEKAILEQQNAKKLLENLLELSELSIKRYKLLSEGICNLRLVEQNIEKSSSVIKTIQLAYNESKQKNEFNLYTQSIFYFYYNKISETNSQASHIFNNIYVKSSFLKSLKGMTTSNIEKFLFEDQCCVLESNLDPENMGVITNLTQNSINVFDMRKDELLYRNVKKVIPRFMNDQHETQMHDWLSTSTYKSINQQKPLYMNTVKNICFRATVYHQISTSFDRIKLYTMVLRHNGENYLLLNQNMKIEGFGEKIKDSVFSVKTLKEPLKNFCLNSKALPEFVEGMDVDKVHKLDLLFCESKGLHGEIRNYDRSNFVQQIQEFAAKALRGNNNVRVLKCKAELSVLKFSRILYCVIKFLDVVQHTMLQSQIQEIDDDSYQMKEFSENQQEKVTTKKTVSSKKKLLLGENSFSPKTISQCPEHEQFYDQIEEKDNSSSGKMDESMENIYEIEEMQKQSTSSISAESTSYSFKKLIKMIKEKFLYEKHISYRQLNTITLTLSIMIIILLLALVSQYIFYRTRLQSFQKIMTANQQVSDTLQYVELMYSQSILIYQNCLLNYEKDPCLDSVTDIKNSYGYFFEQFEGQVRNMISLKASDDFPFYVYLQEDIEVKVGLSQSSMQVQQFLSIFHYTVFKLAVHFESEQSLDQQAYHMLNILKDNWSAIVSINHRILDLYQQQGLYQIDVIAIILFCISGGIVIVDLAIFVVVNYFISSFVRKKQKLVRNYEWVPISYIEEMKKYFEIVIDSLQQKKLNNKELGQFPNPEDNSYYRPKNQFFYTTSSGKRLIFLGCFFLCLTAGNLISLYEMRKVIAPFQKIFVEQKSMISSQKDIIESYYELKTQYLLQKNETKRLARMDKLSKSFKKKEVEFNDRAITLLQIFNDSSSYFQDFKKLLTEDICQLSKEMFTEWQYQWCKSANYDYPQYGIFSTLIFIQRSTMIGEQVLKTAPIESAPQILSSSMYQDIDMYIEYVSKVFYLMQKRISQEMDRFLENAYFTCLLMILLQFLLVMVGVGFWVWFYKKKKKEFAGLYGHVIVYPNKIIIKNKQVMKQIQEGLVIKDY